MAEAAMTSSVQDQALAQSAEQALINYAGVRVWTDALEIHANNGILELKGHVRTHAERDVTENVVLKTPGVRDVISKLYVDTDLEITIGQALGNDPRTRAGFPGILVGSAFGEIYLKGTVPSQEMKKAAEEIAGRAEGVRSVINRLEAPEPAKPAPVAAAKPAAGAKPVIVAKPVAKPAPKPAAEDQVEEETPAEE